ncbi:DNA-binding transcription repressor [Coemansia spiralis]|nr:DNA-binding transcription repressor [Coemansia spiralis]
MEAACASTSAAVEASRLRHKRKGIPRRSPCRRDMVEAPGVVFRFPDKISPGLAILPSAAGLPSGLSSKSAAAVIAAAAAVSATGEAVPTAPTPPPVAAAAAATPASTAVAHLSATLPTAPATSDSPAPTAAAAAVVIGANTPAASAPAPAPPAADLPPISSASSTPLLRPLQHGLPIHRSASNVLHYPELLSDLRDRLIQVHQAGGPAGVSSGVESDSSHALPHPVVRRAKPKRTAKTAESFDAGTAARRVRVLRRGESAHPEPFHRRHSIGALQQQPATDDEDEDETIDVDDTASAASASPPLAVDGHPRKAPKRRRDGEADACTGSPPVKRLSPAVGGGSRRCCASCGASSTPCWRPGLIDSKTLCNLCGLRYKKGKVYCVACSYVPTKTEIATGGASICKRCTLPIHRPVPFAVNY